MNGPIIPCDSHGESSFLSMINAEVEKVAPAIIAFPTSPDAEGATAPLLEPPETSSEKIKEAHHLKASTFAESVLPIDWLSQPVQEYIRTVADAFGCPQDYVAATCLLTVGVAVGKKAVLHTNPYTNYPCDFVCLVGKPSRNKTGPMKEVTRPLRDTDKANFMIYKEEKNAYEMSKSEDKNYTAEPPVFHQRVTDDSSPESRNALLAQGEMIIILADELRTFTDSFGRYSKGGNGAGVEISQLLSIWSNVSFTVNRKSEETKLIDDPALSLIGGIQPAFLSKTFGNDALMESGFTHRFLFAFPERATFTRRRDREQMSEEMRGFWNDTISSLLNMEPVTLGLSHEAEKIYNDYADTNDMKAEAEEDDYIGGVIQKMNIHVLRLAIMIHFLSEQRKGPVITHETMNYAIRVADYFTWTHIERIYPLLRDSSVAKRPMTNGELIRAIDRQINIKSQSAFARALGVSQQYINKVLKEK